MDLSLININGYISHYYSADKYRQLNAAIAEHGVMKVRAYLGTLLGRNPLIKVFNTSKYYFKSQLKVAYYQGKLIYYVSNSDVAHLADYEVFTKEGTRTLCDLSESYYNGYPLTLWVKEGLICEECGVAFIPVRAETLCSWCLNSDDFTARPYNHHVEDTLGFEETKEIRYGIELEYEGVTALETILALKGHALPKRDGSIREGIEVVTRPACIATHKQRLEKFFKDVKVRSAPNTGMHVHIERKRLTQYQIGFMLEFFNKALLVPYIEVVAGRKYSINNYSRVNKEHNMTFGIDWPEGHNEVRCVRTDTDKYSPFNTAKPYTVEVRIFSSPLTHEECSAKLDFVAALVQYSSPYNINLPLKEKFKWENFLNFMQKNKKEFKDFYNHYIVPNKFEGVSA